MWRRVEELPIPSRLKAALIRRGYKELYPPQVAALNSGVMEGNNLLLCSPTASGKTLVAQVLVFKRILEEGGLALYLTPLRALASEKYEDFRDLGEELGLRAALTVGDYDSADPWIDRYDIVVATNEKADSLLRHRPSWLSKLKVVVLDEVHLINEEKRGPTLEMIVARLKNLPNPPQMLALSATVRNAEEIGEWLEAKVVKSSWRPVRLREGVYYEGDVEFSDGYSKHVPPRVAPVIDLALDCISEGGQTLIFAPTRRSAVSWARKLATTMERLKSTYDKRACLALAKELLSLESNRVTEQLAELLSRSVAFHHAGLSYISRKLVEEGFRANKIKAVIATPTLAAGVNLPARRVIIVDYRRYNVELGYYERISVMEYKQMAGRAGRPKYDEYGEAVLIARTLDERDFLWEAYITASPERLTSKLTSEPTLRAHLLATIASGYAETMSDVVRVFSNTLFAHQFGTLGLKASIKEALAFLKANDMLREENGRLEATKLGRRVSSLYIDPRSAAIILRGLSGTAGHPLGYLHLIATTPDMPKLYLRRRERERYDEIASEIGDKLLLKPPDNPYDYEFFLAELKTALLLYDWIEERPEDEIIERYGVGPGDIFSLTQTAEWLAYAASEIAATKGLLEHYIPLRRLRLRLKHGVREELLELVSIRGIGRVRARSLYNYGFRSIKDLVEADVKDLAKVPLIGPKLAAQIKSAVTGHPSTGAEVDESVLERRTRTTIEDFF